MDDVTADEFHAFMEILGSLSIYSGKNIANNAAIIANEKMTFFAYMGIFDVVTKLVIVRNTI